jgi:hypothetical protein
VAKSEKTKKKTPEIHPPTRKLARGRVLPSPPLSAVPRPDLLLGEPAVRTVAPPGSSPPAARRRSPSVSSRTHRVLPSGAGGGLWVLGWISGLRREEREMKEGKRRRELCGGRGRQQVPHMGAAPVFVDLINSCRDFHMSSIINSF